MTTRAGEPRTDDYGVIEQIRNVYDAVLHEQDSDSARRISIDVGAYIGVISLAMAHHCGTNHYVHSFEADDLNFSRLQENITQADQSGISTHNSAVSDYSGTATFTRNLDRGTSHLGKPDRTDDGREVVYEVAVTSLDQFANDNNIQSIELLKIDVEGTEIKVLEGARGLLRKQAISALIVEVPLERSGRSEMIKLFGSHGYSIAYIVRNSDLLINATEAEYSDQQRAPLNLIAATPSIAGKIGVTFESP